MANRIAYFLMFMLLSAGVLPAQISKQLKQMASADSLRLTEIFKDLHQTRNWVLWKFVLHPLYPKS
jgi:hypothetical protein